MEVNLFELWTSLLAHFREAVSLLTGVWFLRNKAS